MWFERSNKIIPMHLSMQRLLDFYPSNVNPRSLTRISPNASIVTDQFTGFRLNMAELPTATKYVWICSPDDMDRKTMAERIEPVYVVIRAPQEPGNPRSKYSTYNIHIGRYVPLALSAGRYSFNFQSLKIWLVFWFLIQKYRYSKDSPRLQLNSSDPSPEWKRCS